MTVCEFCGEESPEVVACKRCGAHFCDECGYVDRRLCFDCADEEIEGYEDTSENIQEKAKKGFKV